MMRAGLPTAVQKSGTLFVTTLFAPILQPCPIVISPKILAPAPTTTPFSKVGWRFVFLRLTPPRVTP